MWYNIPMKLNYDKNSKDPTYFIQMGIRNGKKTTTKNVYRIGKHSELLKITDDPLAYAIEKVKEYNEEYKKEQVSLDLKINFAEKIKDSGNIVTASTSSNIGYLYLQKIYHDLGINSFFNKITKDSKITFDPNLIHRFLTISRILQPDSKLGTHENLNFFYEKPEFGYDSILRTMDILEKHYDDYITHLYEASNRIVKRDVSVCYYDCTNYYFEIESADDDYIDPVTGELISGFRQYGLAKQHCPNPLVEMGLFMDKDGIPLSMCLTKGNTNEQTTAVPLEKKLSKMLKGKKFIYCADAGLGSLNIRQFNSMGGRAFVVTQSVKKLSDVLKEAVFNDCDYHLLSNGKPVSLEQMKKFDIEDENNLYLYDDKAYKVISADKAVDLGLYEAVIENGKEKKVKAKGLVPQKIIVTYSRKMAEYQKFIRERQIARAIKMLESTDPEEIKKGPNDVRRFIKRVPNTKSGDKVTYSFHIDESVAAEEAKYDGFYAIATNLDDDVNTIIQISSNRYKIEDCFRLLKTDFSARPVFHRKKERIKAHFMICYTALLIFRLLEKKLSDYGVHYTVNQIIDSINAMNVANIEDLCYMSTYTSSAVTTSLNAISDVYLDKKYYQAKDMNKMFKNFAR